MTTRTKKTTRTPNAVNAPAGASPADVDAVGTVTKPSTRGRSGKTSDTSPRGAMPRQKPAVANGDASVERKPRSDTKQATLIAMLRAGDGATVEEIALTLNWQAHTVRGALYGALKKKLGPDVSSERVEGRGRVYRIPT